MTTATPTYLSTTAQALIDARLDTIDRMLLGRVPRGDRMAIVREVEAQVHDLLEGRDPDRLDRDDVLAVLARLDPPEAYLGDESGAEPGPAQARPIGKPPAPVRLGDNGQSKAAGIVGLVALGMILLMGASFALGMLFSSEVLILVGVFGTASVGFVTGLVALGLSIYARLRGGWAIVGLVAGILAPLVSLGASLFLFLEL